VSVSERAPSAMWCLLQIALVKLSLSVFGFGRTLARYECTPRGTAAGAPDDSLVDCTAHRVAAAAALYPGRALCLEQSLTLHRALRRRGIDSQLHFGVHADADPFRAHVWVEVDDCAVNEMSENMRVLTPLEG
jgi:hypothetical protein